ncbi:MAG: hypothetical protein ACYDH5_14630 [Acidimicrobiales bacterium]
MTPERTKPEHLGPEKPGPPRIALEVAGIDMEQVERELCRIPSVTAARIVTNSRGVPVETHVLATPDKHVKQLVRDVQSVAMATFGLDLDYRTVSIVQLDDGVIRRVASGNGEAGLIAAGTSDGTTSEVAPSTAGPRAAAAPAPDAGEELGPAAEPQPHAAPRLAVEAVAAAINGTNCLAEVGLRLGEHRVVGTATGPASSRSVRATVARATLAAITELLPQRARPELEGVAVIGIGERRVAVVTLLLLVPPFEEPLVGSSVVRSAGEHDAIVRAVLDATNRRLTRA